MKRIEAYVHHEPDPEQEPDTQPGDYFVSVLDSLATAGSQNRHALLSGPYVNNHAAALADVDRCRKIACERDPRAVFYAFGTCRLDLGSGKSGLLQKHHLLEIGT